MAEREKISPEDKHKYQSRVGMPLYPAKNSQSKAANVTRELSKANNGANPADSRKSYI